MDRNALIGAWRDCIRGADKSWVLFAQGTCVILTQPRTSRPRRGHCWPSGERYRSARRRATSV